MDSIENVGFVRCWCGYTLGILNEQQYHHTLIKASLGYWQ
jgi:hypothetical protein